MRRRRRTRGRAVLVGDVESGSWSRNRAGRVQQGLTFVFVHTQQQLLSLIRNQTQRSFSFSELRLKIILKTQGAEPQLLKKQMIRCFCFLLSPLPKPRLLSLSQPSGGSFGYCSSLSLSLMMFDPGLCPSGSISSCDAFLNVFQTKGLRGEVICPCASSPEALTVAIRR